MKRPHSIRSCQGGMALIESLVSILIFSFGVLGLIGLQARAVNYSMDAENRDRAALLANEITSSMWLAGSVTAGTAQLASWQARAADVAHAGFPSGTVTITPTAGTTNSADIVITWRAQTDVSTASSRQFTTRVTLP